MRRKALCAASAAGEVGEVTDFYPTLNTTNSENLKVYELFEKEYYFDGVFYYWEPTNINVYVSGQAGNATFLNARVTYAYCSYPGTTWEVIFEGMEDIGRFSACYLYNNGKLEAYDDN